MTGAGVSLFTRTAMSVQFWPFCNGAAQTCGRHFCVCRGIAGELIKWVFAIDNDKHNIFLFVVGNVDESGHCSATDKKVISWLKQIVCGEVFYHSPSYHIKTERGRRGLPTRVPAYQVYVCTNERNHKVNIAWLVAALSIMLHGKIKNKKPAGAGFYGSWKIRNGEGFQNPRGTRPSSTLFHTRWSVCHTLLQYWWFCTYRSDCRFV